MSTELQITLGSDATFGRGEGLAGLVDSEVEHDEFGLPFLRGRTLKGLLAEECANLLFAAERQRAPGLKNLKKSAGFLFGDAGSRTEHAGRMHVGNARLPSDLCQAVAYAIHQRQWTPAQALESLTAIRRQTAMDPGGAPTKGSLRSMRVILRGITLVSRISFDDKLDDHAGALLTACALCLRRAGTGRNRGRGRIAVRLWEADQDVTDVRFSHFEDLLREEAQ